MAPAPSPRPAGLRTVVAVGLSTDVVVVGGGPAASWAALSAAESGGGLDEVWVRAGPVPAALAVAS